MSQYVGFTIEKDAAGWVAFSEVENFQTMHHKTVHGALEELAEVIAEARFQNKELWETANRNEGGIKP